MKAFPQYFLLLAIGVCLLPWSAAWAADPPPIDGGGVTGIDLKTQLEKGLRARRPVEFEYIDKVIKLVEDGTLPRPLVTSTFAWAQKKPSRQMQYFQFALQARASKLGIKTPPLNNQSVGTRSNGGQHGFGSLQ